MVVLEKADSKPQDWIGRFCRRMVVFVGTHRPDVLSKYVDEKAEKFAIRLTMLILDQEGINHCAYCPRRFQLRKTDGNRYICPQCIELIKQKGVAK